jgi:hypothetical protein
MDHKFTTILTALKHLFSVLEQLKIRPGKIECDNEIFVKRKYMLTWLQAVRYVKVEPSPPYVKELDGAAERSGGVIKDKARSMR